MKFSGLCLLILILSSCMLRTAHKRSGIYRDPAGLPDAITPVAVLPAPDEAVAEMVRGELFAENRVAEMKLVTEVVVNEMVKDQVVLQKEVSVQQTQKQVQQKKAKISQKSREKAFVSIKSKLELKRPLISGPSQFDSRIEPVMLNLKDPGQKKIHHNAFSIGIVIEKDKIHAVTDTSFQLEAGMTLKNRYKLCPDEAFADQPVIGIGTAFIIGQHTMVTAGHVFTAALENYVVVFGFEMLKEKGKFNTVIPKQNIYHPARISHKDTDLDLMVFEVEENITKPALIISKDSNPAAETEIYMIGYPSGLPEKIALNADILENNHPQYFYTSLDAFQGNSGSPVFSRSTHEVIGVLVSGEVDYIWNGSCNKSSLCQFPYCKGEKVMKISALGDYSNL